MKVLRNPNKKLVLWNKLDSFDEVTNSVIGPDGAEIGIPTYPISKFDSGVYDNGTSQYGARFPTDDLLYNKDAFTIDFWTKYINLTVSGGTGSRNMHFMYGGRASSSTGYMLLAHRTDSYKTQLQFYDGANIILASYLLCDIALNDVVHWRIVWDTNGIDGGDKLRLYYFNETNPQSLMVSGTTATFNGWLSGAHLQTMPFLSSQLAGIAVDNLKVYNYAKTDLSDIDLESPILIESPKIYSDGQELILWNKLGILDEVENSVIGPDGVITGAVSYSPCNFDDGVVITGSNVDITFPDTMTQINDSGTIEAWVKPAWNWNDGVSHFLFYAGSLFSLSKNSSNDWQFAFGFQNISVAATHTASDLFHISMVWNISGIDGTGTDTMRVYIDGAIIASGTATVSAGFPNDALTIGNLNGSPNTFDGVIDNVKVYNYAKTDFSDRLQEGMNYVFNKHILRNPDKKIILWNKLGSDDEVENSEIGINGTIPAGAPGYEDAVFNKGSRTGAARTNYPFFDNVFDNIRVRGCIELWAVYASDTTMKVYDRLWTSNVLSRWTLWTGNGENIRLEGDSNYNLTATCTWTVGVPKHVAVSWDTDGIPDDPDNAKVRIFIDGQPVVSTSGVSWSATFVGFPSNIYDLYIGTILPSYHLDNSFPGPIDNLKMYNYAKTDFSDRFIEEPINLNDLEVIPESRR